MLISSCFSMRNYADYFIDVNFKFHTKIVPNGDECKTWTIFHELMTWAFAKRATKKTIILAFGGGAVLNVTGLFAATLYRGTDSLHNVFF